MRPQRRGIFVTSVVLGLTLLVVSLGVVLAVGISAKPTSGPRDDGTGIQTKITVSGDLSDTATFDASARAYWDLPNPSVPDSSYEMTINSATLQSDGSFIVDTEVPLYDVNVDPVRPGLHQITVCASPIVGGPICRTTGFTVQRGVATLSKTSGRQGDPITISGSRWVPSSADEAIRITWAPSGANQDMIGDQFGSSTWSYTFNVPDLPAGTYPVRICNVSNFSGACSKGDIVVKQFTILDPKLILSRSSGLTGQPFDFSGQIFYPSQPLRVYFGPAGKPVTDPSVHLIGPASPSTNADGNFGPFTYAPSEGPGDYTVTACTVSLRAGICNPFDTATKPYTITAPTPTPSPSPKPTATPTPSPTAAPTASPTATASPSPTTSPTATLSPTLAPTEPPTATPSAAPTATPSPAPTAAPTPTAAPSPTPEAVAWPEHLHSPRPLGGGGIDLTSLGTMSLLALLIAFLVPFPGTLFNKTVEANYGEIMGWIGGLKRRWTSLLDKVSVGPLGTVRRFLGRLVTGRLGVLIFLGLSALIYGFLSPTFGFDANSLALFLGLLVGLAFITAAFDLPLRIYHGRTSKAHDRGVLRALWWTLLVAVICVIVSRLAGFQPGYLYGLVVSIVFVTEISTRDEGVGTWLASIWLIVLSFVAWGLLAFVRQGAFDPWFSLFLQTVLVTFVVAGIETLAVGLLPMRFLPGHPLYEWRRGMWFAVFALSVLGYLLILVDPANGYLSDDSRTPMLVGAAFLVIFGIVSLGTWAYFRFRPARPGGDRPGEAPAEG